MSENAESSKTHKSLSLPTGFKILLLNYSHLT